jgi:hypothetical protein
MSASAADAHVLRTRYILLSGTEYGILSCGENYSVQCFLFYIFLLRALKEALNNEECCHPTLARPVCHRLVSVVYTCRHALHME